MKASENPTVSKGNHGCRDWRLVICDWRCLHYVGCRGVGFAVGAVVIPLILALLAAGNEPLVVETRCDIAELNHYHDEQGRHIFSQWIWWEFDRHGELVVVAWRMDKGTWRGQPKDMTFHDGDVLRRVKAGEFRETATLFDPEVLNREYLPSDYRRGLGADAGVTVPARWMRKVVR